MGSEIREEILKLVDEKLQREGLVSKSEIQIIPNNREHPVVPDIGVQENTLQVKIEPLLGNDFTLGHNSDINQEDAAEVYSDDEHDNEIRNALSEFTSSRFLDSYNATSPNPPNRQRSQLTMGQKREICMFKESHPKFTQKQLRSHFQQKWDRSIGKSTIHDILSSKSKWLNLPKQRENMRRIKKTRNFDMEEKLYKWIVDNKMRGITVSNTEIVEKAQSFGEEFDIEPDFAFSNGWLHGFKWRYALNTKRNSCREITSPVVSGSSNQFMNQLHGELKFYNLSEIYCVDEFELHFNSTPVRATVNLNKSVVIGLCTNSNGSDKIKPMVVSDQCHTAAFGTHFKPDNYVWFKIKVSTDTKTRYFSEWLMHLDEHFGKQKKKVLLLLKFSSSHEAVEPSLVNIKLMYLPQSVGQTGLCSPFDIGLLSEFKCRYRCNCVRHFLMQQDFEEEVRMDLRTALHCIYDAWNSIPPQKILKQWQLSNLLSSVEVINMPSNCNESATETLKVLLEDFEASEKLNIDDYINIEHWCHTGSSNQVKENECVSVELIPTIQYTEAKRGLLNCIRHTEQLENSTEKLQIMWNIMKWMDTQQ